MKSAYETRRGKNDCWPDDYHPTRQIGPGGYCKTELEEGLQQTRPCCREKIKKVI